MKKTLLCLALSLSGMAIAQNQTNLLKHSNFTDATGFEKSCNSGESYSGSQEGRNVAIITDKWVACGGKASLDNGTMKLDDSGSTPVRQVISNLTVGHAYKVKFNVKATADRSDLFKVLFKNHDDLQADAYDVAIELVSGSSEGTNITAKEFQVLEAGFSTEYQTYEFKFVAAQTAYAIQFQGVKQDTGSTIHVDNFEMYDQGLSNNDLSKFNFSLSPNPAKNHIALNASKVVDNLEIYNSLGQSVKTVVLGATSNVVNIAALNKGVYIAKVDMAGQIGTYRFIKQ